MANQALASKTSSRQAVPILDIKNMPQGALEEFERAISRDETKISLNITGEQYEGSAPHGGG